MLLHVTDNGAVREQQNSPMTYVQRTNANK